MYVCLCVCLCMCLCVCPYFCTERSDWSGTDQSQRRNYRINYVCRIGCGNFVCRRKPTPF